MTKNQKKEEKKGSGKNIFTGLKNGGPEHFGVTPQELKEMEKKSSLSSFLNIGKDEEE